MPAQQTKARPTSAVSQRPSSAKSGASSRDRPVLKRNALLLRTDAIRQEDSNLLQDLSLDGSALDTIPDQIRTALDRYYMRVIDIFRQFDDSAFGASTSAARAHDSASRAEPPHLTLPRSRRASLRRRLLHQRRRVFEGDARAEAGCAGAGRRLRLPIL